MITYTDPDEQEGSLRDLAPDLTPMLDVMFILIVFFMLTANSVFKTLDITLPEKGAEAASPIQDTHQIVLEIRSHGGGYALDERRFNNVAKLKEAILSTVAARPDDTFVIASDKDVKVESLLEVLTFLSSNDIEAANILMREASEKKTNPSR